MLIFSFGSLCKADGDKALDSDHHLQTSTGSSNRSLFILCSRLDMHMLYCIITQTICEVLQSTTVCKSPK